MLDLADVAYPEALRLFEEQGCRVTVVPATTPAKEALEMGPDGVFFSNGPGDPAAVSYAPATIRTIAENEVPVFGICLGHSSLHSVLAVRPRSFRTGTGAETIR